MSLVLVLMLLFNLNKISQTVSLFLESPEINRVRLSLGDHRLSADLAIK